jgi:alpha-D-xyloside xylohydrolase
LIKATHPLHELVHHWRPIFADPAREYHFLDSLVSFRRSRSGGRFRLATDDQTPAHLRVTFVQPQVVRIQAWVDAPPPDATPMLIPQKIASGDIEVAGGSDAIVLRSSALTVRAQRHPWRLAVYDTQGREVFGQQRQDRTLLVYGSYPIGYSRDEASGVAFHESFALSVEEHFFGLGQQYGPLDKRGQRIVSWSRDPHGFTGGALTYHNIPFFLSNRGYGIFVNHTSPITYELGWPSPETGAFRVEDPYLDYFLIYGPQPKDILARYHQLTGRPVLPPLWSFGVWMSRCMYVNRPQVEEVVTRMRELGIPCDVVNLDPLWLKERRRHMRDACDFVWDEEAYPDPPGFVRWLGERGVKLCLWENPYIWKGTAMYEEGQRQGFLVRSPSGEPARPAENPEDAGIADFTNPAAARWWQSKHRPLLRMGVAAFKSDYGEAVPADAVMANGKSGREMHNVYPLLYNRAVYEIISRQRGEAVVFGRSGYAGSQRYPINWVGDSPCTYAGMAAALRAGLSLSLSGIPFWSHDIGGFWNPNGMHPPSPELYIRWAQFGLLSSHARFHGVGPREPWVCGDQAVAIVRDFARLRYRLLPYLWGLAHEALAGVPVARPLFLEFPNDPLAPQVDLEYMLGPYLLVAPLFNDGGRRRVYLPPGQWFDFWTNQQIVGPTWRDTEVPLERVPLFVRGDSILPFAPAMDFVGQKAWEPIQLDVRLASRAAFSFPNPEHLVEVSAERKDGELRLELGDVAQSFEVRFLTPERLRDVRVTGRAADSRWEEMDGAVIVRLRAEGPCAVEARVV